MKKLQLFAAMTALCTGLQAQPLTGINTYQYSQKLVLTDGTNTSYNSPGFIMSGVHPSGLGSSVFINKTDVDGMFNGNPWEFAMEYRFVADMVKPCGGTYSGAQNCYGVTLAELKFNAGAVEWYAIAAGFDRGCLFSTLDMNGNIVTPAYYTFPTKAVKPTKPIITQSFISPGNFYITGSYQLSGVHHMYVMVVDINGNQNPWTWDYTVSVGAKEFIPSAAIESPYANITGIKELIVVGTVIDGVSGLGREGFFLPIDINTGIGGGMLTYGAGVFSDEKFLAINTSDSNQGFIIGGYSDYDLSLGSSWMLRTDAFGTPNWSTIIPASYGTRREVVGVTERLNTSGKYEYYGASTDNKALTVYKLDDNGAIFGGGVYNEFIYNDNINGYGTAVAISYDNKIGAPNEGIHVYGTNLNTPADYLMARACFNGAAGNAGCTNANITLNVIPQTYKGPAKVSKLKLKISPGPLPCTNFLFGNAPTPINVVAPCNESSLPTTPYVGDQSKSAGVTGIKSNTASDKFNVSPNPVTDKLLISYSSNTGSDVSIGLYNNLGQLVTPAVTPKAMQGANSMELDLNTLNLNSGVYFVTVTMDGASTTKKIIYTK